MCHINIFQSPIFPTHPPLDPHHPLIHPPTGPPPPNMHPPPGPPPPLPHPPPIPPPPPTHPPPGYRNTAQTGQLNPLFHTFADLVNRVRTRPNTDWLVSNSLFSPTAGNHAVAHGSPCIKS